MNRRSLRPTVWSLWAAVWLAAACGGVTPGGVAPEDGSGLAAGDTRAPGEGSGRTWMAGPGDDVIPSPEWTLRRLDGTLVTLGELRGQPVFVNFWATWCAPCVQEMASIRRLAESLEAANVPVAFLLVSSERERTVRAFVDRYDISPSPVLEETLAPEAFGELVLPTTAVLDPEGRMVFWHRGAADWSRPEVVALLTGLAR